MSTARDVSDEAIRRYDAGDNGMEVAHVPDGKIVEYHTYWGHMATAEQLGRLPEPSKA